ncbi:Fic family protein [Hoylesella loescheii]|jgi:fic family protein|uniref:Fic family protein n=1 Tax=Hoylesella loescheii TaxID=840 RepID=UPI00248D7F89|nr:DNA-binding protein [Hoylesella loescheii]
MAIDMQFVSTKEFAEAHGVAERTVRNYCVQGKIQGAQRLGRSWRVPVNATLPTRGNANDSLSPLLKTLRREKDCGMKGGIYHHTQIALTYNSNHIEGSCLTEEQTRYIFETNTIGLTDKAVKVDDIVETTNHFRCIDFIIDRAKTPLTEQMIKHLHALLKGSTSDSAKSWFATGDYKRLPNEVGGIETTAPKKVGEAIRTLLKEYRAIKEVSLAHILDFHHRFETIHPFQDGNGRIGRLIMFKECLNHNIVPFIITDELKMFYYRGLRNWPNIKEYLLDTCLTAQDSYKARLNYFEVKH